MKNEKSRSSFETIKHSIQLQNVIYETATQWSLKWFHFQTSETRSHIGEVSFPSMKESVTNNMIDPCYNASQQRRSGRYKGKINEFIISFIMNFSFALHSRHRRAKFVFFSLFFLFCFIELGIDGCWWNYLWVENSGREKKCICYIFTNALWWFLTRMRHSK